MKVLMLVKSDVLGDARVMREAETLAQSGHRIQVVGLGPEPTNREVPPGVAVDWVQAESPLSRADRMPERSLARRAARWMLLPSHRRLKERRFVDAARRIAARHTFDVVHAHDFVTLPLGAELATRRGARLVYDAHECWSGRFVEGRPTPLRRRRDLRTERTLGSSADAVLTVSPALAAWLRQTFGWAHVTVVRNSFPRQGALEAPLVPRGLLYAGRIDGKRDLATVIEAARHLPDLPVKLMGPVDQGFLSRTDTTPVHVMSPRPIAEVSQHYQAAGLAMVSLADSCLNHRLALPNKLFQAVQAGVPVIGANLPEIRRVICQYGVGVLYEPGDVRSLVVAVREALRRYQTLSESVRRAADPLSWERDAVALTRVYATLARS